MNNYFWLVLLPNIECFFCTLGIIGIVACVVGGFIYMSMQLEAYNKEDHDNAWIFAKKILKVFAASMTLLFISCFIPSKNDIVQLKIISVVSELNGSEQIPQKLVDRLNAILDDGKG